MVQSTARERRRLLLGRRCTVSSRFSSSCQTRLDSLGGRPGGGEDFFTPAKMHPKFFLSCTKSFAFSTLLDPDGPAGAGVGVDAHAQNTPIKDDVHSVTKHFWESNVAQGNENECRFNQILFYMTLPLLISCVCLIGCVFPCLETFRGQQRPPKNLPPWKPLPPQTDERDIPHK